MKSGSQVPLSVLVPKSKSRSWSSLFWNFCFQFENPNHFSTIRFGTFTPETKGGTVRVKLSFWNMDGRAKSISDYISVMEPLLQAENPKTKFHNSIIQIQMQIETWIPPQKRMETLQPKFIYGWVGVVGGCICGGGERKHYSCWGVEHYFTPTYINLLLPRQFNTITATLISSAPLPPQTHPSAMSTHLWTNSVVGSPFFFVGIQVLIWMGIWIMELWNFINGVWATVPKRIVRSWLGSSIHHVPKQRVNSNSSTFHFRSDSSKMNS